MGYANYEDIEYYVGNRMEFTGNSAHAVRGWDARGNAPYRVFSYGTEIARVNEHGEYLLNVTKYSRTTSRLQNLIRRAWEGKFIELTATEYREW